MSAALSTRIPARCLAAAVAAFALASAAPVLAATPAQPAAKALTTAEILAASTPADWRPLETVDDVLAADREGREIAASFIAGAC